MATVAAPISAVLQLEPATPAAQIIEALRQWLDKTHGAPLESAASDNLMVEWRQTEGAPFTCRLVTSDSTLEVRRTITVICDDHGSVALIEESPFATADVPRAAVDLSSAIEALLGLLLPLAVEPAGVARTSVLAIDDLDAPQLLEALGADLAPGLLIAVVDDGDAALSTPQAELLGELAGLALPSRVLAGSQLFDLLGLSLSPRAGCLVSVSRTPGGLEAHVVPATSLRTKTESARRLIVRRQLAAPVPFDLERRRSLAMARLLTGSGDVDLPTAMQLWEEETERATALDQRVKELETLLELAYEEQDSALGQLDTTQSELRYLQKAFKAIGEIPIVVSEDDDGWIPETCVDALNGARELLPFLVIGAVDGPCEQLDLQQKRSIWAKKIWATLRALNDYCRAKSEDRFSGELAQYQSDPPDGAIALLAEYAPFESKSTGNDSSLVALRTFKVPSEVEPAGKVYMQQHLKIDRGGQFAPRIHIHDGSGGITQRVYVGYVGPHLPTANPI